MSTSSAGRREMVVAASASAVAALLIVPAVALGAPGDFALATGSPEDTGQSPWDVVAADFNGDGDIDLATANGTSGTISVFLGDGTGDFAAAPGSPEPGAGAFALAAGDLDGDDDIDLAAPDSVSAPNGGVDILLNDGDGDFSAAAGSPEPAGGQPREVAIADFNADDDLDIAVGNLYPASVTILINDGEGDGDLTALAQEDAGGGTSNVTGIAAAQLDNDTDTDVVVLREFTNDYIPMSNANGLGDLAGFSAPVSLGAGAGPGDVVVGNFGSNAFNDLAIVQNGSLQESVPILIGAGDGTFTPAGTSPELAGDQPTAASTADFNGDGNLDLAVANGGDDNISILLGNGAGNFTAAPTSPEPAGSFPIGLAVGDLGGDANVDIATTSLFADSENLGDLRVLINNAEAPPVDPPSGDPGATPTKKKCKKGRKLKKGKCVKKKRKK